MHNLALCKQIKAAAFLEGEFTTRAGKKTSYYIDKYLFETKPEILDPLADALATLFPASDTYDRIGAPELGAVPIAALLSVKLKKPFIIVRKNPKEYGTTNLLEGEARKGERVVVVEDILTTGGAVLKACKGLEDNGLIITQIIGIINREEGAFENIKNAGHTVIALFTSSDLKAC